MRSKQIIRKGVLQATTGQTDYVTVPTWARNARVDLSVVTTPGTSNTTDFQLDYAFAKPTAAVAVSTTVTGVAATTNEVQTVTLTGGPTHGEWYLLWGGVSANASIIAGPFTPTATAAEVNLGLRNCAGARGGYDPTHIVDVRTGTGTSGDPYIHTLTFSGATVDQTDVDAVTVRDMGLHTYVLSGLGLSNGWNGITQIAETTAADVSIWVGSDISVAEDDTGAVYFLPCPLPNVLACKTTLDRGNADETYTYMITAEFYS